MRITLTLIGLVTIAVLGMATPIAGQAPTFKRTELQRADISIPGKEVATAIAELPTGVTSGRHTHPGEEAGYVLEGSILLEVAGKPPMTLKAGQAFVVPAVAVHSALNNGSGGAKVLSTYIIEKGKPVASPVQ